MTDTYSRSGASPPGSKIVEPTYEGDFVLDGSLPLECGGALICPTLHYAVYGRLNAARDNAVLVCHALSGSALVGSWWPEIFAPGAVLSLEHDFVICINMLGSCYGSTGPGSVNPETGESYGPDFPLVSVRDNVRAQARLLDSLGIRQIAAGAGRVHRRHAGAGLDHPSSRTRGARPHHRRHAAFGHGAGAQPPAAPGHPARPGVGRRALSAAAPAAPRAGAGPPDRHDQLQIRAALRRALRPQSEQPQRRRPLGGGRQGGEQAASPADASTSPAIWIIRGSGSSSASTPTPTWPSCAPWIPGIRCAATPRRQEAFGRIRARLSFIGISTDWLFPAEEVRRFAESIRQAGAHADYREMTSDHGHDAFLAEQAELVRLLQ